MVMRCASLRARVVRRGSLCSKSLRAVPAWMPTGDMYLIPGARGRHFRVARRLSAQRRVKRRSVVWARALRRARVLSFETRRP
eukprot:11208543-Lingulodinium_polyedra.AAC.1